MSLLAHFLPRYQFSERHACVVDAPADCVLAQADAYRPENDRFFRVVIGLRELPMRLLAPSARRRARFGMDDFALLGRNDQEIVHGLIGRLWQSDYGLRPIADGAAFLACDADDVVKLALGWMVTPIADGRTQLTTETRVFCPSRATRAKFLPYWLAIRPVSGLVRRRMLASVKAASERLGESGSLSGW